MWVVSGRNIEMTAGDFGIELPIEISGVTLGASDSVLFTLKNGYTKNTVFTMEFINISNNTVNLVLTAEQSEEITAGEYIYNLDWYQNGQFMCNIINGGKFKVVYKA